VKIGLAVSFFDFRNDVRRLISALRHQHEVVIFCLPRDEPMVREKLEKDIDVRVIRENVSSFSNAVHKKLFLVGKKLPKSRENFYLMEQFKLQLNKSPKKRLYAKTMLEICYRTPAWYSYDGYLDQISYSGETSLHDVDTLIFFTEIIDDGLLARAIKEGLNPLVYVYSWDHPCKHVRFSNRVNYLVWSRALGEDLQQLQGISVDRIHVLGASQFCYIEQYHNAAKPERRYEFPYIYFGCAIGIPELVGEEIARIRALAAAMDEINSPFKLVVRPYPVLNDWGFYRDLQGIDRIVVDDSYRTLDLSVADAMLMDKFATVEYSAAFFHMGTTLGFEACFVDTPSFILDFGYAQQNRALSLRNFVNQYQNRKYLMPEGVPNVIRSQQQLLECLKDLESETGDFLAYNRRVTSGIDVKSFNQLASDLASVANLIGRAA